MTSIEEKKSFILKNENQLASRIALDIIHKPQLSLWMILIPFVFVYYFYGLHRFANGKKEFVKHFVLTRQLILDAAIAFIETNKTVDYQALARQEKVPPLAIGAYIEWAKALCDHYVKLLQVDGKSYQGLVRARYFEQGQFLMIVNQISQLESRFYRALSKELENTVENAGDVIKKMEHSLEHLRRKEAQVVFS
jgi:hypothetical protein